MLLHVYNPLYSSVSFAQKLFHQFIFYLHCPQLPSSSSSVLSIFDFDPEEIARQMTIIDFSLFEKIRPCELLNQVSAYVW